MRHGKRFNHLGRKKGHREAMLNNMASSLILHKRIFTTTAKAKALRKFVEPLITKSKDNTTHSRRVVFGYLQDKDAVNELYTVVAPKVGDRPGGYTRILKTHNRLGDNAEMCMMELVDFNELMLDAKAAKSTGKAKRTRRGKKTAAPKAEAPAVVEEAVETAAEEVVEATEAVEETVEQKTEAATETVEETVAEVEEVKAEAAEEVVEETAEETAEDEAEDASENKEEKE